MEHLLARRRQTHAKASWVSCVVCSLSHDYVIVSLGQTENSNGPIYHGHKFCVTFSMGIIYIISRRFQDPDPSC